NQGLFEEGYAGKTQDIVNYIADATEVLIPETPTDETSFGFYIIPLILAFLGTVLIYIKKRNK
ncbi:MAG: hypothetical protein KAJ30_08340, partial [Candidatus Heimdallarchaeota archaeon]|nr:hypothetical protein [Candidatus Heimdallarchaeota archaeon]